MRRSKQREPSLREKPSDMSVPEKEMLAKAEIRRLQNKFRIAADKMKSYGADVRRQMQAQEKEIESLTEKRKDLSITLSLVESPRNVMLDERNCVELQHLFQKKSRYDSVIRDRKALLADLDKQLLELERKVVKQNQIATKVKQANSSKQLQKWIDTLELRLNNVIAHFDTILTRNNELREQIECLRIQKAVVDHLYLKLHKKLDQQNRRMNADVEQAAQAYERWTEPLARISAMNEMRNKEIRQYNIEKKERNRAFEQETRLRTFMVTKSTDRSELEEQARKKKVLKAAQRAKRNQEESVESQEVAYKLLQELAEDGDIDQLLNSFVEKEKKNFSSFRFATQLNVHIEMIQRRTQDLQKRITALTVEWENTKSSTLLVLQELEKTLIETIEETKQYEDGCKKSSRYLDQLKSGMNNLLEVIDYDDAMTRMHLKEDRHTMDENLMKFFGLTESKTKELLLLESVRSSPPTDGSKAAQYPTSPLLGSTELLRTMDGTQLCRTPMALGDITKTINTVEVPLDHGQLSQLILQNWKMEQSNTTVGRKRRNNVKA
ncbi:coiled-coil domain-containing protein 63 [Cuculus canorus]|uniref:coiled-coil domain-containing protein 63 n=1 Tax=Cuculus canorus TaxID=55661 RepID=UPI0023AA4193|nr:coiled-coil domain-containing protein 63 [Cuculus canorus]